MIASIPSVQSALNLILNVIPNVRIVPKHLNCFTPILTLCGPGSSVGIATGYGLDGPGIETRWGRDFPHLSRPALGPTQPPVQWIPGFLGGTERLGRDANPSPPSSAVVMRGLNYTSSLPVGCTACTEPVPVQGCTLLYLNIVTLS